MDRTGLRASSGCAIVCLTSLLSGCATFSPDGGFGAVREIARARLNQDVQWARSQAEEDGIQATVKNLLAGPLKVDDAVQVALLNNRGLQATYAELGIAEADLVQAGRLKNPKFAYLNVHSSSEMKIERALTFDFMQLITMPLATKLERRRFEATQFRVAAEVLKVAVETRRAYFNAISARQTARCPWQVAQLPKRGRAMWRRHSRCTPPTRVFPPVRGM